uniref:2-hydroxyacyl-CoA lyase n=1 Tax=Leersia perrieri TaxID=77586 RepID=A0A0D9V1D1_9ORYZ
MATDTTAVAKVDGSALAGRALAAAGARHMFGVVGIPVTSLASRAAAAGVRFLAFRNEQSAGYAAAAYGYLTGAPGLLLTVSGPGCVHGLAGLSHATANAWPLLMVSGSCSQPDAGRGDFQELDQIAATKPFVKLAVKATTIADIPRLVFQALASTVSGRPGGCYLDIPADVLHQTLAESEAVALIEAAAAAADSAKSDPSPPKHKSLEDGIEKAAELLRRAERPLVVVGKGAAYARAEDAIRKLVDTTGIPFLPTPMGKGVVPDTHPLSATAARSLAIGQCDVALVVGARLNWLLHFGEPPKWSKDVKFILVDVCEEEIELRKPHLGLVGDAKRVVELVNKEIKDQPFCLAPSHPWVEAITKKAKDNVLKMEAQLVKDVVPFNFLTPMRIIRDAILAEGSPSPVLVSEGANTMDVGRAVLVQNEPRTRLDAGTWGTMGVGLGFCVAAAVAEPDRLVVAVEGDSGFGFSAMEVETLVRYQLPVVVIVFNNNGVYGGDRRSPDEITGPYKDDPAPTSFVPAAAYHKMMEAFGGKGYLVETPDELKSALSESFRARKPAVINVIIDPYAGAESGRMQHKN